MGDDSKLRLSIAGNRHAAQEEWLVAEKQSAEYAEVLELSDGELSDMDAQHTVLSIELPNRASCKVFAKHVSTPFSDGRASFGEDTPGWKRILQARLDDEGQFSTGGGTSYFTTLPVELHRQVLSALREEHYELGNGRIWP